MEEDKENQPAIQPGGQALSNEHLMQMYQNCLKLASENKITGRNTWSLSLIDHLPDLVQPLHEEGDETNFQRASCTLETGVKIYSSRVDSAHTEAYKILAGLGRGESQEHFDDDGQEGSDGEKPAAARNRAALADLNPSATLEASFDALNVKKFDLAFQVDPLFHKTSAKFDAGGAQGLLLTNLSVFHACEIMFDSMEKPGQSREAGAAPQNCSQLPSISLPAAQTFDPDSSFGALNALLKFAGQQPVDQPAMDAATRMVEQATDTCAGSDTSQLHSDSPGRLDASEPSGAGFAFGADDYDDGQSDGCDVSANNDQLYDDDNGVDSAEYQGNQAHHGAGEAHGVAPAGGIGAGPAGMGTIDWLLSAGDELQTKGRQWAGSSHWRYHRQAAAPRTQSATVTRGRKKKEAILDFENLPPYPAAKLAPAANKSDICLKTVTVVNTLLPQDHHYKAASLTKLFLKPDLDIALTSQQPASSNQAGGSHDDNETEYYTMDGGYDGGDDDGDYDGGQLYSEGGEASSQLLQAPRQVAKVDINYAKASKQVDVRQLKEELWHGIHSVAAAKADEEPITFQDIISQISSSTAAGHVEDLSVHLCFICALHLANEHGLAFKGSDTLDQMHISNVPL